MKVLEFQKPEESVNFGTLNNPEKDYFSPFGGLWIDRLDFAEIAQAKLDAGEITPFMHGKLTHFSENGFVTFKEAVSPELCDAVRGDIQKSIDGDLPRRFLTGFDTGKKLEVVCDSEEHFELRESKMIDLHFISDAAKAAIFNSKAHSFLKTIFDDEVLAFASLTFKYGSTQPLHRDTAFVLVDHPMRFAAIWIALEDITEGSGELLYIPGSHRMPEYLFNGKSKWFDATAAEADNYGEQLKAHALKVAKFLPKKGDVLIWHSDLVHGGGRRTDDTLSRWSLVSHMCPLGHNPNYFYNQGGGRKVSVKQDAWVSAKESKLNRLNRDRE